MRDQNYKSETFYDALDEFPQFTQDFLEASKNIYYLGDDEEDKFRGIQITNRQSNAKTSQERRARRKEITPRPPQNVTVWSIAKSVIGKDIAQISLPVNLNEPLSLLQKMAEEFEYSHLLDSACKIENSLEQMAHIAAFSISSYSTATNRLYKPFSPLLSETYECDRTSDYGWKCIAEKTVHNPPTASCVIIFFYTIM